MVLAFCRCRVALPVCLRLLVGRRKRGCRCGRLIAARQGTSADGLGEGFPAVSPLRAAFGCCCPRCGKGRLFAGLLTVRAACEACGLDLSAQDAGDGPAVFVTLLLGLIIVSLATLVEIRFAPPIWVHLLLWTPLILGGAVAMLRPLKALLIALQYRHHRLAPPPS